MGGCSFDVNGLDAGVLLADGPTGIVEDGAEPSDSAGAADLTAPRDLATIPDLAGACLNGNHPTHVADLAEGDLSDWGPTAPMPWTGPLPPTLKVEADNKSPAVGLISVRLTCSSDAAVLTYPKAKNAAWDLSGFSTIDFFIAADDSSMQNAPGWAETDPHVIVATSDGDQFVYVPDLNKVPTQPGTWISLSIPLEGGGGWTRSQTGNPSLANINYLAFSVVTHGTGFKLWVDGVTFGPGTFVDCTP